MLSLLALSACEPQSAVSTSPQSEDPTADPAPDAGAADEGAHLDPTTEPEPSFGVEVRPAAPLLIHEGRWRGVTVLVRRSKLGDAAFEVSLEGLPAGIGAAPKTIAVGKSETELMVTGKSRPRSIEATVRVHPVGPKLPDTLVPLRIDFGNHGEGFGEYDFRASDKKAWLEYPALTPPCAFVHAAPDEALLLTTGCELAWVALDPAEPTPVRRTSAIPSLTACVSLTRHPGGGWFVRGASGGLPVIERIDALGARMASFGDAGRLSVAAGAAVSHDGQGRTAYVLVQGGAQSVARIDADGAETFVRTAVPWRPDAVAVAPNGAVLAAVLERTGAVGVVRIMRTMRGGGPDTSLGPNGTVDVSVDLSSVAGGGAGGVELSAVEQTGDGALARAARVLVAGGRHARGMVGTARRDPARRQHRHVGVDTGSARDDVVAAHRRAGRHDPSRAEAERERGHVRSHVRAEVGRRGAPRERRPHRCVAVVRVRLHVRRAPRPLRRSLPRRAGAPPRAARLTRARARASPTAARRPPARPITRPQAPG